MNKEVALGVARASVGLLLLYERKTITVRTSPSMGQEVLATVWLLIVCLKRLAKRGETHGLYAHAKSFLELAGNPGAVVIKGQLRVRCDVVATLRQICTLIVDAEEGRLPAHV